MTYHISYASGNTLIEYTRINDNEIMVKLNLKRVGTIRKVEGGWQYFPQGQKKGGIIGSLTAVKKSIEN